LWALVGPSTANAEPRSACKQEKGSEAIAACTEVIKADPRNAEALVARGKAYIEEKERDRAIADFTAAIAIDAASVQAYVGRATSYRREGQYERALADLQKAFALQPGNALWQSEVGWTKLASGDYAGAASAALVSLKLDDASADTVLLRHVARRRAGEDAGAELREHSASVDKLWPYAVVELFLGERTPQAILAYLSRSERSCQSHLYIAHWHVLNDDRDAALEAFRSARSSCPEASGLRASAEAEEKRIEGCQGRADVPEPWRRRYLQELSSRQARLARLETEPGRDQEIDEAIDSIAAHMVQNDCIDDAEPLRKRAVTRQEARHGPSDPRLSGPLVTLAKLHIRQRKLDDAKRAAERSLAILQQVHGRLHPELEAPLTELIDITWRSGTRSDVQPLYEWVLEIKMRALAEAERAESLARADELLGESVKLLGQVDRWEDAQTAQRRQIGIRERLHGLEHPKVGEALEALARTFAERSTEGDARLQADLEALYKRALAIREKHSPQHPDTAALLEKYAELLATKQQYAPAERLYERALAIRQSTSDFTATLKILELLERLYSDQSNEEGKIAIKQMVMMLREKDAGIDPAEFDYLVRSIANDLAFRDSHNQVREVYERALAVLEGVLGDKHLLVGARVSALAEWHDRYGKSSDAEPLHKRSIAIVEGRKPVDYSTLSWWLQRLARSYFQQERLAEAEPLFARALAILENEKTDWGPVSIAHALADLGDLYHQTKRHAEAEAKWTRALDIVTKEQVPMPQVRMLNSLGALFREQARAAEAEKMFVRAIALIEAGLLEDDIGMRTSYEGFAEFYTQQGVDGTLKRFVAALMKGQEGGDRISRMFKSQAKSMGEMAISMTEEVLALTIKGEGEESPSLVQPLSELGTHYFKNEDWSRSAGYYKHLLRIRARDFRLGSDGNSLHATQERTSNPLRRDFEALVKASARAPADDRNAVASEMFVAAQEALMTETAASVFQMAARAAAGSKKLSGLARERQAHLAEWQERQRALSAAMLQGADTRDPEAERTNATWLAELTAAIAQIDKRLGTEFPKYASLVKPSPLTIDEVKAQLRDGEALLLFLDTRELKPTPEETFIWAITKTDVRWVRSTMGASALAGYVTALRCGLDPGMWKGKDICQRHLSLTPDETVKPDVPLPFDLARSQHLYQALLGEIGDVIKHKHLLIVASGPLATLPFHALAQSIPSEPRSGIITREVSALGVEMREVAEQDRSKSEPPHGVRVTRVVEGSPAEKGDVRERDIILRVGEHEIVSIVQAVRTIRAAKAGTPLKLRVRRDNGEHDVEVELTTASVRVWSPLYLDETNRGGVRWLADDQPVTMLPSASSLAALRTIAKPSSGTRPMFGIGNPLLEGDRTSKSDIELAKAARERASCQTKRPRETAKLQRASRSLDRLSSQHAQTDRNHILGQPPLPETADELCAVAKDMNVADDHIMLGARATETNIKRLSENGQLAQYRLLHFATHAALAGELKGTTEPGLILTPGKKLDTKDDGFLSASEVTGLKLDADWVVLSACNTAASSTPEAEALSGLARSFIYAGARALLVSHWAVESVATAKLVTETLAASRRRSVERAEALRRAMVGMIRSREGRLFHPMYWAPFVVVGG
jgi:CHAT domain-containing protein/tetratricopeptide (TPR) repeat protein